MRKSSRLDLFVCLSRCRTVDQAGRSISISYLNKERGACSMLKQSVRPPIKAPLAVAQNASSEKTEHGSRRLYCRKCIDTFSHQIALHKMSVEQCRSINVVGRNANGTYKCRCENCSHTWNSRSAQASIQYE